VLTGTIAACRPAGAGWEADLRVGENTVICRLPDKPSSPGDEFTVTVLEPPYFRSDGKAVVTEDGRVTSDKISR